MWHGVVVSHASTTSTLAINIGFALPGGLVMLMIPCIYTGWNDIAYNFLVCEDGRVYEGRGWTTEGAHTLGYNAVSLGVCIIGDYTSRLPAPEALEAAQNLLECGVYKVCVRPIVFPCPQPHYHGISFANECALVLFYRQHEK